MAKMEGTEALFRALKQQEMKLTGQRARAGFGSDVIVGYEANYAVHVHENLQAHHENGQAKFLEQPAREKRPQITEIIIDAMHKGKNLIQSLLLGGLYLQRESQKIVPVDTGNLKASAFTRVV